MSEEQGINELISALRRAESEKVEGIEKKLTNEIEQAEEGYQTDLEEIDRNLMNQVESLMSNHNDELSENIDHFQQVLIELKGAAYHWDDEFWHNFSLDTNDKIADCHRVGTLKVNGHFNQLETLALAPIINGQNVIFLSSTEIERHVIQAFQSLILRLIITSPKGKIRLVPIEPVTASNNVFSILLGEKEVSLGVEDNLDKISQHLSMVKKTYLTEDSPTLLEIMAQTGSYPVPNYILAVAGFPHTFSEKAIRQLMKIMQKGPVCGIHTIILVDTEELPDLDLEGLDHKASVISYQEDRFVFSSGSSQSSPSDNNDFDYFNFDLELDRLPELSLLKELVRKIDDSVFDGLGS